MPEKPPPQEEESGEGAPIWIISFADMISLLMAFFVMLTTFADFGSIEKVKLKGVGRMALAANYGWHKKYPKESVAGTIPASGQVKRGSEKPTLESSSGSNRLTETTPKDFRAHRIFLLESKKAFWADGVALSTEGRNFLDMLASYVAKVPARIVISETGQGANNEVGILRAVTAVEYLVTKGVSKDTCSVAATSMVPAGNSKGRRMLEITLLDESIYK